VLGETWLEVPEAISVEYNGVPGFGIGGKDIILRTLGALGRNTVAMERSVEFGGDAASSFTTDMRFTICNMTAELGGLNGIFAADEPVAEWLGRRRRGYNTNALYFRADADAPYISHYVIKLGDLVPQVAKPFSPDNVYSVTELAGQRLDGAFIGACTTTEEELALAALVLEAALKSGAAPIPMGAGRGVVVPGDLWIANHFKEQGLWAMYEQAGFTIDPPNCSMCLGIASRKAGKGEVWLSSQNRNFENRMGEGSLAWLASAATVAASSLSMEVRDPRPLLDQVDRDRLAEILQRKITHRVPEITISKPEMHVVRRKSSTSAGTGTTNGVISGTVQRFGESVDTDAIIPGEFCHLTDLEALGDKCFYYVRPEFRARARAGATLIVAGDGWGCGSSREQAVWALQGAGIQAVIAPSYAFIHKRNLVNEALPYLVVKDEAFYRLADEGVELQVDLANGIVRDVASGQEFQAQVPTPMIQALTAEGGLVAAVQHHGKQVFSVLSR
jgi:3-isopropylmalate dehydratase small subunit